MITRIIYTTDQRGSLLNTRPLRSRDDLLAPITSGKLLVSAMTWQGDLAPRIDAAIDIVEPLVSGFAAGRVLHAEATPANFEINPRWLGDLSARLVAARDDRGAVDVTSVLAELENLRRVLGTRDPRMIADAQRRLRRAHVRVGHRKPTGDSWGQDALARARAANLAAQDEHQRACDRLWGPKLAGPTVAPSRMASGGVTPNEINARNAEFWAKREGGQR